ncbi:MAG TPA: 4Fe-4S binding protein, partial [Anaerolineaceae bacterium]|nr:4Fe-4S binding protein [Anaerolineaceae bacterium]
MPPRGRIEVDERYCKGCGLCVGACPSHVLALDGSRLTAKGYHP